MIKETKQELLNVRDVKVEGKNENIFEHKKISFKCEIRDAFTNIKKTVKVEIPIYDLRAEFIKEEDFSGILPRTTKAKFNFDVNCLGYISSDSPYYHVEEVKAETDKIITESAKIKENK